MNKLNKFGLALALGALALTQKAQAVLADPTDIVTSATTAFESVATLVVAVVGFYIIVRIVRGIRAK